MQIRCRILSDLFLILSLSSYSLLLRRHEVMLSFQQLFVQVINLPPLTRSSLHPMSWMTFESPTSMRQPSNVSQVYLIYNCTVSPSPIETELVLTEAKIKSRFSLAHSVRFCLSFCLLFLNLFHTLISFLLAR